MSSIFTTSVTAVAIEGAAPPRAAGDPRSPPPQPREVIEQLALQGLRDLRFPDAVRHGVATQLEHLRPAREANA